MTNPREIYALRQRVELPAHFEADRETDCRLYAFARGDAVEWQGRSLMAVRPDGSTYALGYEDKDSGFRPIGGDPPYEIIPRYCSDLGAALLLLLPGWGWSLTGDVFAGQVSAYVINHNATRTADGAPYSAANPSPARAILLAALAARQAAAEK